MNRFHAFSVTPALPPQLEPLRELAYNLRWSWDHHAVNLFRGMSPEDWERSGHNPVLLLGMLSLDRIRRLAEDSGFLREMATAHEAMAKHLREACWFQQVHADDVADTCIAYFSAEFGITECLAVYSGGLGILAGDHLKSASELGLPLVGVTLLYQKGYFRQYLNTDGWQQEKYPANDFNNLPILLEKQSDGLPVTITVDFPDRSVQAQVWKAQVGRVALYLLDTNLPENDPRDHNITHELYGGDKETRIQQEIMLGIGGFRALHALGIQPTVCHMNEGHSAFLALERARLFMAKTGCNYDMARQVTSAGNVFTTHTPVPAGFDIFHPALVQVYFENYAASLGLDFDEFMALGRVDGTDKESGFNMAVLAMKHAPYVNGVSALHGRVSREMMEPLWPGFRASEVPVSSVTNGIHTRSWLSKGMTDLLDKYLGENWSKDLPNGNVWDAADKIPGQELWEIHERQRLALVAYVRKRLRAQFEHRGLPRPDIEATSQALDPSTLTIGFARRFATYKRATLLLSDPDRLKRILTDPDRPVQFIFGGKAHPKDDAGKEFLRQIVHFANDPAVRDRIAFVEDYDIAVARTLVQGVDLWLNTPRRPYEASGTSGMKVVPNGGLNMSVLDGWWPEGYTADTGWAIGSGEEYTDPEYQDRIEAQELYEVLEREVIPLFYQRDDQGLPNEWIRLMRNSIRELSPLFNTNRMVREYCERSYLPASRRFIRLSGDGGKRAESLTEWRRRVRENWNYVRVESVSHEGDDTVTAGSELKVSAWVNLGALAPDDVAVQVYHGAVRSDAEMGDGEAIPMSLVAGSDGRYCFEGALTCNVSGMHAYAVRILPSHQDAVQPYDLPLIRWEE